MLRGIGILMRRELSSYLRTPLGYVVLCATLLVDGLLFNAWAAAGQKHSTEVLELFFFSSSGPLILACIFIAMRSFAEERQNQTLVLLATAPLRDSQVVLGKFMAAWVFCGLQCLCTVFMPVLIFWHGKVAVLHIVVGYCGLMLLASATLSLSILCSALSPNQLVAAVTAAALVTFFIVLWLLARIANPPIDHIMSYLALHDRHFRPFMHGILSLADVVFYVSLTYSALVATIQVLTAKRWY